ncbi:unnamed protein product [Acanthosepion pharaonis]|uniref:Uncharacterized protein n=1 Tax=Acanthosepion pharaonis TaxID=158019 RepID=A0A812CGZ0_ACAPH|nr:unnamed protein product [Sepia pharaonis]
MKYLSICLCVYLSNYLSIYLSQSVHHFSFNIYQSLHIYLSIYLIVFIYFSFFNSLTFVMKRMSLFFVGSCSFLSTHFRRCACRLLSVCSCDYVMFLMSEISLASFLFPSQLSIYLKCFPYFEDDQFRKCSLPHFVPLSVSPSIIPTFSLSSPLSLYLLIYLPLFITQTSVLSPLLSINIS